MAQRYTHPNALKSMAANLCPECGEPAEDHLDDDRFWIPRGCDITPAGVTERIEQYRADVREAAAAARPKVRTFITTTPQLSSDARQYEVSDDVVAAVLGMPPEARDALMAHAAAIIAAGATVSLEAGCGCSTSPDRPEGGDPTGCYCTCSDDGRDDCEHGEPHPAELFARQDQTRAAAEREIDAALAAPATGERRLKPRRKTLTEIAAAVDDLPAMTVPRGGITYSRTVWVRTRKMRDGERVPGPWHIMETDYKSLCGRRPQRVMSAEQRVEPPAPDDHLCVECVRHRQQGTSRAVRS